MTTEQIKQAIEEMKSCCDDLMNGYRSTSARRLLIDLDYSTDDQDAVLKTLHENGFRYCLDSRFKCSNGIPNDGRLEYPPQSACIWGPDQLKSRLQSVYIPA